MAHAYLFFGIWAIGVVGEVLECWMVLGTGLWKKAACWNTLITFQLGFHHFLDRHYRFAPAFPMVVLGVVLGILEQMNQCKLCDLFVVLPNFNTAKNKLRFCLNNIFSSSTSSSWALDCWIDPRCGLGPWAWVP